MEDYLFLFISNPIAAMSIHIIKKYTFTVLVSLIFSVYIYYKQKKVGINFSDTSPFFNYRQKWEISGLQDFLPH